MIALVGGGLIYAVQVQGWSVVRPSRDFKILIALINLAIYLWIRVWSRLSKKVQFAAIGLLIAAQAALLSMVRLEGFTGDGRIVFRWRWTPTPEERLAEFASTIKRVNAIANLPPSSPTDSPSFRGSDRTGRFSVPELEFDWNEHPPRELWRHPVGRGWSSFAVVGDYCVTQEQRGKLETVVCYELSTGSEVWQHVDETVFEETTSGPGPRATPTIHEGRVYTFGATGIVNCIEGVDGGAVWTRTVATGRPPIFGYVSSPLIHGQRVYVTPGGESGSVVCLDRETGSILWSKGSRKPGYSSPQLAATKNENHILVFDAVGLHGHDAQSGDLRWSFPWGDNSDDNVNVCLPVIISADEGTHQETEQYRVLISSGYGRGTALLSIHQELSGEWVATERWRTKTLKPKFNDVIVHGEYVYGLDDGILTCISLTDGSRRWKKGRYGYGQMILVNEMLLVQGELGSVVLVKADPREFTEVASLAALKDRTWTHPVVSGKHLLVRNDREAACYLLPFQK
jgi:outer membrane protein assembly factor BamB